MKAFGYGRKRLVKISILMAVLLLFSVGLVLASSGGGHGEEAKGWAATDTYRVMNFVVLAVALYLILRKPVSQALGGRIQGIREQLSELEEKKKEAENRLAEYNERLSLLDQEAEKLVAEYTRQGEEAKARIIQEAEAAAIRMEDQAKRNIEHEFDKVKKQLQAEIIEKALVKAEEIIANKITDGDQERLIDEYLGKVVA